MAELELWKIDDWWKDDGKKLRVNVKKYSSGLCEFGR